MTITAMTKQKPKTANAGLELVYVTPAVKLKIEN
jgi:hypothetical protein